MATIDMTQRKLKFPPRFLPYLEKHRIFELFHECIEMLVQVRPRDHIRFLKNVLPCADLKKNKQRIVFLAPPCFDRETFCQLVAECLGIQAISRNFLLEMTKERKRMEEVKSPEEETLEEESCICPGEEEYLQIFYPEPEELPYAPESVEEECVGDARFQEPCICVCPCVKKTEKQEKDAESGESRVSEETVEGEWEGEGLPCIPHKKEQVEEASKESESSIKTVQTDYGLLTDCELAAKGWILEDFPMTGQEAEQLSALGVIPTHAIRIVVDEKKEMKDKKYKWIVLDWMKAYKSVPVTTIHLGDRTMSEFSRDMCRLMSVMPHRHAPMLPRVVLVGSRGAGVTTQAQKLANKYGMIHVEFEIVIERALQQDDEMSNLYRIQKATRPDPELEALLLERALLSPRCLKHGWVLTGYPRNIDQMRMLDIMATPPNRIIFIEVPARECFVRLYYRKFDPCLGDEYKLPKVLPVGQDSFETSEIEAEIAERLQTHPKNNKKQIIHDIESYFLTKKHLMDYCGKTASYIDGNKSVDAVFELLEQILINPSPPFGPRDPLAINFGIEDSHQRLKKFRLSSGMLFNNLVLNPPEHIIRV